MSKIKKFIKGLIGLPYFTLKSVEQNSRIEDRLSRLENRINNTNINPSNNITYDMLSNELYQLKKELGLRKDIEYYIEESNKTNKPLVSVIIPVYGVEKYLRKCLDSVVNQTLKNIEIIIVNDCSPDNSESIILEYSNRDSRIVYIKHEVNKRYGGAINTGINNAHADYITIVESDDWVELDMIEYLYREIIISDSDLVITSYVLDYENENINPNYINFNNQIIYNNILYKEFLDFKYGIIWSPWSKLYRKNLFNEIRFPENMVAFEDLATVPLIFHFCKKVLIKNKHNYHYFQREGQSVATASEKHIKVYGEIFEIHKQFMIKKNILSKDNLLKLKNLILTNLSWYYDRNIDKVINENINKVLYETACNIASDDIEYFRKQFGNLFKLN